jgi:ketol-acid reductoisomerase
MAQHSDQEVKLSNAYSSKFAIIGYGSQARAWMANLTDSSVEFSLFLRPGATYDLLKKTQNSSHPIFLLNDFKELNKHQYFIILIPDDQHLSLIEDLAHYLPSKSTFIYAHGYSVLSDQLPVKFKQFGHILLAPKAIASEVRARFLSGEKLSAVVSQEHGLDETQDAAVLDELCNGLGVTQMIMATFQQECFADLISEQAILCSTLLESPRRVYELMLRKGIPKEVAFVECFEEMKLIVDTLLKVGPEAFFQLISPNALCGGSNATEILFDSEYQQKIENLWKQLENGSFFQWMRLQNPTETRQKIIQKWRETKLDNFFDQTK